ncbi:MAG: glycine cleavage system aminomethyltransferase GcvT [Chitinispirillaceae bacterium]
MKKTVLHQQHLTLGAKMAPFGGYDMPIQYEGIIKEHTATRSKAAIFDTCHMGEFIIEGETAVEDLERLLSCNVDDLKTGSCRYGFLCNEQGGVLDDQILYRLQNQKFMMVVNAANEEGDFEWIRSRVSSSTVLENISRKTAKIDVQGPRAPGIIQKLLSDPVNDLKFYRFMHNSYKNTQILISRTGYTGEIGFEIYCSRESALDFWNDCLREGATPAGLGARDTLRLEMGFPLYGHELDSRRNAAESGFKRAISSRKQFIGSQYVLNETAQKQVLRGIRIDGRRAARHGDSILSAKGETVGVITSGSFSPTLECAIAMGYMNIESSEIGTEVSIRLGRGTVSGIVTELPFYKESTARADIRNFLE